MTCPSEQWRPIPGWTGLYEASDLGRIRPCSGRREAMKVKWCTRRGGRMDARVNLSDHGKVRTCTVSRLVAAAWCPGYAEGMTVNHIDGNPANNRADNRDWVTLGETIQLAYDTGMNRRARPLTLDGPGGGMSFPSIAAAGRALGVSKYVARRLASCPTGS